MRESQAQILDRHSGRVRAEHQAAAQVRLSEYRCAVLRIPRRHDARADLQVFSFDPDDGIPVTEGLHALAHVGVRVAELVEAHEVKAQMVRGLEAILSGCDRHAPSDDLTG